jgi:hypothetical protein
MRNLAQAKYEMAIGSFKKHMVNLRTDLLKPVNIPIRDLEDFNWVLKMPY